MKPQYQSPTLEITYVNENDGVLSISTDETDESNWTPNVVPKAFNKTPID